MAIHRGIQSALFYYLSCAPCTEARTRRHRRKEADLARAEKAALQSTQPELYQYYSHPLPSNTNPGWDLEIAAGPSKESKAAAKQRAKKESHETPPRSSASTSNSRGASKSGSTPDASGGAERTSFAAGFQRDTLAPLPESTSVSPSQISVPQAARIASTPHPPINDLHPSTVTKYTDARDISWMLAPPPPAKVMRGLEEERVRKYMPRLSARHSVSSKRSQARTGVVDMVSPTDVRGLGLALDGTAAEEVEEAIEGDDESSEVGAGSRREGRKLTRDAGGMEEEKRDSADPEMEGEQSGFLFPPPVIKDAAWERRDSGTDEASKDGAMVDEADRVRWRWSIDW